MIWECSSNVILILKVIMICTRIIYLNYIIMLQISEFIYLKAHISSVQQLGYVAFLGPHNKRELLCLYKRELYTFTRYWRKKEIRDVITRIKCDMKKGNHFHCSPPAPMMLLSPSSTQFSRYLQVSFTL